MRSAGHLLMGAAKAPQLPTPRKADSSATSSPTRRDFGSAAGVLELQRSAGNAAVAQRLATVDALKEEVGGPRPDVRIGKLRLRQMSVAYKRLLFDLDAFHTDAADQVATDARARKSKAAELCDDLEEVALSSAAYVTSHAADAQKAAKRDRVDRIRLLAAEARLEKGKVNAIGGDERFAGGRVKTSWREALERHDERQRLVGEAKLAVEGAEAKAAAREGDDLDAARQRLVAELKVPVDQVDDVLTAAIRTLASAPLTINFSHKKLALILKSGGFRNYWQVNKPLSDPGSGASKEDRQKFDYQQDRLEGERRLFGGTSDAATKFAKGDEQAISTGANIVSYRLGAAPSRDYGRSVAVLNEAVKHRATYTPWDALDIMKRIRAGERLVGPEVVGTRDNLAAIIRHTNPGTLKAIVERSQNPGKAADEPVASYVEAQIHGPLTVKDIDRITFNVDDIEDEAYDSLQEQGIRATESQAAQLVASLRAALEQTLRDAGIACSFAQLV